MFVRRVELTDFRNYKTACLEFVRGTTAVLGDNGQGKTNLAEALAYLTTLESFRGVPTDAMIRIGAETAIIRAEVVHDDGRELLIEAELSRSGRNRVLINKQRLRRTRDLLGAIRATVFSPDDLSIIKGGPQIRRNLIDDALVALDLKYDTLRLKVDRILRQRNTLLRQAGGRLTDEIGFTLDVWDAKLAESGDQVGQQRAGLVAQLNEAAPIAYQQLAAKPSAVEISYRPQWLRHGLANALAEARTDDIRRCISTVGPHRDDIDLVINGLPARTQASQGEQRTLALALRLALHRLVADNVGSLPILILDDVLSELDHSRATALIDHLPAGQVIITSASGVPTEAKPDSVITIEAGIVR